MVLPGDCQEREIQQVISHAIQCLNQNYGTKDQVTFGVKAFVEGHYFGASAIGKHYELYFKTICQNKSDGNLETVKKMILSKPVDELHVISVEDVLGQYDEKRKYQHNYAIARQNGCFSVVHC